MRIVGGAAGGLRLAAPAEELGVRPTSDKVREALFNTINVSGKTVLDLFAGSGAVGCEAVSRGAARVVMAEQADGPLAVSEKNLRAVLRVSGLSSRVDTVQTDAAAYLSASRETFDLIFCDPPYALESLPAIAEKLKNGGMLNPGGVAVLECATARLGELPEPDRIKRYGDTSLLFYYRD